VGDDVGVLQRHRGDQAVQLAVINRFFSIPVMYMYSSTVCIL
jgi:hypothetical protein